MRLRRLVLARYGHLADQEIAFPDAPGLHIVLGLNEAGKSTALSAIGDALFRFPHRTPYDFLHATRELRIGVELQARDGRRATFFRRKGRKDDLSDADDNPVAEAAIAAFLGGATRERFDGVFGLDGAALRAGGLAILEGKGDAGSAIMGAYTGMHDFRRLADRLDVEAGRLYGDRKGNRAFHDALGHFQEARKEANERRVDPEAFKAAAAERDRLEQAQRDNAVRLAALHAERTRLDRTRRTTPLRLRLAELTARCAALGPAPDLPEDAARRFAAAIAARDEATRDLERLRRQAAERDEALAALPPPDPVLGAAEAIDALAKSWERIAAAMNDREALALAAAQHAATMEAEGAELGLTRDADALAAMRPSSLVREQVVQAVAAHDKLLDRRQATADRVAETEDKHRAARTRFEALPDVAAPTALRGAIERVREEGRLDAALAEAEHRLAAARADRDRVLAGLPLWTGDAGTLAAMRVPLAAEIDRMAVALDRCRAALRDRDAELGRLDQELVRLAAEARASGELPTVAAIRAARQRRDQAWALIRRVNLEGGTPITDGEREILGPDSAAGFEALVRAADALADRRAQEQERVVAAEQRQRRQTELQALRVAEAKLRGEAADRLAEAEAAWLALWRDTAVEPAEPAAMKEWLTRRDAVLTLHHAALAAARDHDALLVRHGLALDALAAASDAPTVAARLKAADARCKALEAEVAAREAARAEVERAETDLRRAQATASRVEAELADVRADWGATALALPPDTPASMARVALRLWQRIDDAARDRQAARDRIAQIAAAIDRYATDTAAVIARVAGDLAGEAPLDAVRALADRLDAARRVHDTRTRLVQESGKARAETDRLAQGQDAAAAVVAALCARAGVDDEDGLCAAIERAGALRAVRDSIRQAEADLRKQDDGKTLAELAGEAEGVDFDSIQARIVGIETEIAALDATGKADLEALLRIRGNIAAMEQGHDAAASAQAMETALADIDDVVVRYPRLRMAQVLLRAGIERFRREQQGPLLARAGQMFARLTEGRYDRLEVDEGEDGKPFVVARRPDGIGCQAHALSEGTLDQLYLALRLAAIETEAQATEPLPFIGDDLLVNFDDNRARAALRVLGDFSRVTQVILFTHHDHIAAMAEPGLASVHRMGTPVPVSS
ncbi:MAG TPA: AAA family ATPase [Rhodopila sp.]|uniref:AAA family ATPase n=1 Tax=Rhodopila sp. TaxID=2480087 RepID=UPI002C85D345|nr:AAA family ATPase [Rhodopila sp.]HVY15291.1 AAA family ATPase [Rhodopila sp.]